MEAIKNIAGVNELPFSTTTEALQWISDWRFEAGVTPFSHPIYPVVAVIFYVSVLVSLTRFMAHRKPLEIPMFLFFHNILLCIGSLILAVWLTFILGRQAQVFTPHELICSKDMHENGHLHLIYYINSGFKFWEFLDTFLLVVRKKPVPFLHSYHHAATLVLTWVQLREHSTCQWVPIFLNLWVHVAMYYYYAMSALKYRIWWKKHLTTMQITQFVIDVVVVSYAYSIYIFGDNLKYSCHGTATAAIVGLVTLTSYLLLFIRFFIQTYRKSSASKRQATAAREEVKKTE